MRNDHIRQETKEKCQPWNDREIGGLTLDVMRNDHTRQETKEKCQPWNDREIGGRSATVPHHTRLLYTVVL